MKHFTSVHDLDNLDEALQLALSLKKNPYQYQQLGKNKTLLLVFFNSSLRTRLSTQKAGLNLGMNVIIFDINEGGWKLETELGVIMDGDKPEHIREAVPVIGKYCDIIGVRSFARFGSRKEDYKEIILRQFVDFAGVPVVSMETATRHPLQSFADLLTIEEHKRTKRPKIVLSWAPHPRPLPQAVPNSFVEWIRQTDYELVITHPKGYELSEEFTGTICPQYDQMKAFEGADFIYAKSWAAYNDYGKVLSTDQSWTITDRQMTVTNQAQFMHCLPVRRNMIVSDSVIDGPDSIVIEEAGNRLYSAQAVLKLLLDQIQ